MSDERTRSATRRSVMPAAQTATLISISCSASAPKKRVHKCEMKSLCFLILIVEGAEALHSGGLYAEKKRFIPPESRANPGGGRCLGPFW